MITQNDMSSPTIRLALLALATLGYVTQTEMILGRAAQGGQGK
jgi:hypothetical protein